MIACLVDNGQSKACRLVKLDPLLIFVYHKKVLYIRLMHVKYQFDQLPKSYMLNVSRLVQNVGGNDLAFAGATLWTPVVLI